MAEERTIHIGIVGEDSAKKFGFELITSLAKLPNVELITTPEEHSLILKFCTVQLIFTNLKKLEEKIASTTTNKFDGGITFWKTEDHSETTHVHNSNDDIGTLQKVGIFNNDYLVETSSKNENNSLKLLINKLNTLIINTSGFIASSQFQPYTDSFEGLQSYFHDSDKPIPFYRKNLWALMGALYSTIISLGVFGGLAIAGLLATPFVSIPIIFAVLAIVFVVKIVMDNRPSSVGSHVTDNQNWPTSPTPATPQKQQNVFAQARQENQKFIAEQIEKFEDFLVQKKIFKTCFNIDVSFPMGSGPILQCTPQDPNSNSHKGELIKLRAALSTEKRFKYDEKIEGLTISIADFNEIYKPSTSPEPPQI